MIESLEKRTSKRDLSRSERPPNRSDLEIKKKDDSKRCSWGSLSRVEDNNKNSQTDGCGASPNKSGGDIDKEIVGWGNMTNEDISSTKQNEGCDTSLNKTKGYGNMNRQAVGWSTDFRKTEGDGNRNSQNNGRGNKTDTNDNKNNHGDGWGAFLNKTDTNDNKNKHADGWGTPLDKSEGWGSNVSPGLEAWSRHSPTISPKEGRGRSSRSPRHGSKHRSEIGDTRASNPARLCRDYIAGKCRRGWQCRFIHDDSDQMHPDSELSDFRGSRSKRGRYSMHEDREKFTDLWEKRDRSGNRFSDSGGSHLVADYEKHAWRLGSHCYNLYEKHAQSHGSNCDGDYEKHSERHGSFFDDYEKHSQRHGSLCDDYEKHSQRHGSHYRGDHGNHEGRGMSSRSAISCYAFSKGRCQRGSACRFAHIDAYSDGGLLKDDNARDTIPDRIDANTSFRQRLEPLRTSGNCYSEDGMFDGKRAGNLDNDNSLSWNGPKWGDEDNGNSSSRNGGKRGNLKTIVDASDSSQFRHDHCKTRGTTNSMDREGSIQKDQLPPSPQDAAPLALASQELNNILLGQDSETSVLQPIHEASCSMNIQNQFVVAPHAPGAQVQQSSDKEKSNFPGWNQLSHPSTPIWQCQQKVNPSGHSLECLPQLPHNSVHNEEIIHSDALNGSTSNQMPTSTPNHKSGGLGHQVNPQHCLNLQNTLNCGDESRAMPYTLVMSPSEATSDTFINKEVVISGGAAQMTNIPASLLSENDQHLPQHHTCFNATGASGLPPPQAVPNLNSVRPAAPFLMSDFSNPTPGFPSKLVEAEDQIEEPETKLKRLALLSDIKSETGNLNKDSDLEDRGKNESKPFEIGLFPESKEVKEMETREIDKVRRNILSEELDAMGRTSGEDRREKDDKELKIFKVALVEFVKDILKPTWKEGSLSKEAHKTIVKKVVEKVMGTMQGPTIPHTKERIDIYLTCSKPKIEKLVQAYVQRYVKTSILS